MCSIFPIRRGSADSEELVPMMSRYSREVLDEAEDVDPGDRVQQRPEHADDEHRARDVEGDHQDAEAHDGRDAGLADDRRDRAEGADRGEPQDHAEDAEHQHLQLLDREHDRLALFPSAAGRSPPAAR
jgi:hypothetical protein